MSKRQERRQRRLAEARKAEEAKPVLCIDCSYFSERAYWHYAPHCAGAKLPPERQAPTFKKVQSWPRLKGWKDRG